MALVFLASNAAAGAVVDGFVYGRPFAEGAMSGLFMGGIVWVAGRAGLGNVFNSLGLGQLGNVTQWASSALVASLVDIYLFGGRFSPTEGLGRTFVYFFFLAAASSAAMGLGVGSLVSGAFNGGGAGEGIGSDMPAQV